MRIELIISTIFATSFLYPSHVYYAKTKILLCPESTQECVKYDTRHLNIAHVLSYKYLDRSDFRRCVQSWKDRSDVESCEKFEREIFELGASMKLPEFSKTTDKNFIQVIEAYTRATRPYWGSDAVITNTGESKRVIENITLSIKKYSEDIANDHN